MQGSVVKRGRTWSYVVDVGRDPVTTRRRQRWKPGRKFARQVNKLTRTYAAGTRAASMEDAVAASRSFLDAYRKLAIDAGEDYYAKRWELVAALPDGVESFRTPPAKD